MKNAKRLHPVWLYYYEKIEPIFAEIVPLEHDLFECLKIDEEFERENSWNVTGKACKDGSIYKK